MTASARKPAGPRNRHCPTYHNQPESSALKPLHIATLLIAVAIVSTAYSIILPVLPFLIERMGEPTKSGLIATHTGLLTATYTLAIAIGAPQWGKLCDHMSSRQIILIGLAGLAATLIVFSFFENIYLIYLGRFLSGLFAAAPPPAAMAAISLNEASEEWKARRLSWLGLASMVGSLIGPIFGGVIVRLGGGNGFALTAPFLLAAAFATAAATLVFVIFSRRHNEKRDQHAPTQAPLRQQNTWLKLLTLAFIAGLGISSFDVLLTIHSKQVLALDSYQIGLMFSECSLVMFLAQALVFSPLMRPVTTRYLIAPAFVLMVIGLMAIPYSDGFPTMWLSVGSVAAGGGVVAPVLIYWISLIAGERKGEALGKQVAVASLGQALGAALSGLLLAYAATPVLPFVIIALLILLAFALSLRLPSTLIEYSAER